MKRTVIVLIATLLVIMGGVAANAQDDYDDTGKLSIPWGEFKRLLNLDDDDIVISLETFQKLLAQTGAQTTPPHTLRNGNVVLTREQFDNLVNQMKPPPDPGAVPPFDHLITKATYAAKMHEGSTSFTAAFNVHVLKPDGYVKVPILPQSLALSDMKIDGNHALVVRENGYHTVVLPGAGEYAVTASYSVKSSIDKGPHKIDLAIQQTPITLLTLEIPLPDIDVEIPQAQYIRTQPGTNKTTVSAVIGQGSAISVRWRKKVAVAERIPPKLYSEVHHLMSIQDDALKVHSDINYTILHSEVDAVQVAIPDEANVLAVTGEGVGEWQETSQDGRRILAIPFTYGKKGSATVSITTEMGFSESGLANAFTGLQTLDTVRETGFLGMELATSGEVSVTESDGLEKVAVEKLPRPLIDKSARPLIMGFKYLKHPYSLVFDVKKHEKIAVPVATINSASVVTLFTEDGKIVHRLVYQVRNSSKQFLEIKLPEGSDVWSVFVGNRPVESSVSGEGELLVPLIRSRSVDNRLDTFPVEVVYCTVQKGFSPFGSQASMLPSVDLITSQLIWSVYLPNDYSYVYFESTLEKEEIIRGVNVLSRARRYDESASRMSLSRVGGRKDTALSPPELYKGEDYRSEFRNVPLEDSELKIQLDNEREFAGRLEGLASMDVSQKTVAGGTVSTGVLPIQIRVPTSGQVYRFARTIIRPEDPLSFSVVYTRLWVITLLRWMIFLVILLIIYLNRRPLMRIARWVGQRITDTAGWIRSREEAIKHYAQSVMTLFVLAGFVVIFWSGPPQVFLLFFFLFWISVIYQLMRFFKSRMHLRAASKAPAEETGPSQP